MAQLNIYLPDELHRRIKAAGIPASQICQEALRQALGPGIAPEAEGPVKEVVRELEGMARRLRSLAGRIEGTWED